MLGRRNSSAGRPRRKRRIRKLRLLALVGVLGILALAAFTFGVVTAVGAQLSALDPAHQQRIERDGYIYANDGHTILAVLRGSQSRVLVPFDRISPFMVQAIVAAEDKRFYEHRGLDLRGMARALIADVRHKKIVEGGSTITQQFVKNAYVSSRRTISRKLREAALAWQLEQRWSKNTILQNYLNTIYFGNGSYGIERAARTYFGHSAAKLTLAQSALLAGIPEDPSRYDPIANPGEAKARRAQVLRLMLEQGRITPGDFRRAVAAPMPKHLHLGSIQGLAPYFGEYVKQQLIDRLGTACVFGGGLQVRTTIDLGLQKLARAAISKWLPDPNGPQAALVAIRPSDGAVLAMYGGNNFRESQFNLAVQGERQPGSSFKPFVLATALREGISPATTLDSHPVSIYIGGRYWAPDNYEGEYLGPITLATATAVSDNSVFAQLTKLVGPRSVAATARRVGITSHLDPYFAIGLGADPVNPLEMARAYSTFANGGVRVDGTLFGNEPRAIASADGCNIPHPSNRPRKRRSLSPTTDAVLTQLLQGVVTSGTGRAAALGDRPVAGKTGTTENYGDAWFVGYTPQLAVAVWVGYPTRLKPMLTEFHGDPVVGGTFPALIWRTFTQSALKAMGPAGEPRSFPSAPYLYTSGRRVTYRDGMLQLDNGYCRDTSEVVYFSGFGPRRTANCKPNEVDVPRVIGWKLGDAEARLAQQPLTPQLVYKPARPKQRVDIVLRQFPASGTLSSFDHVTLVLAKPLHGVVPHVVGLPIRDARARLRKLQLTGVVRGRTDGPAGRVVSQAPSPGVAAAPGMQIRLVVAAG
ncbi:MAG TPA: PBP1A family penicillin-binding protein [Gaiellaceae bacterium]